MLKRYFTGIVVSNVSKRSFRLMTRLNVEVSNLNTDLNSASNLNTASTSNTAPEAAASDGSMTLQQLSSTKRIDPALIHSLQKCNFLNLTPVQGKSIIPIIDGKDGMVVRAKTGTGKTLAFVIPSIQTIINNLQNSKFDKKVSTVVIAPTRDLALQIQDEYFKVIKNLPSISKKSITIGLAVGGKPTTVSPRYPPQIVISTPGRLKDILSKKEFTPLFSELKFRIYDEADRMLDQGFEAELEAIDYSIKDVHTSSFQSVLFSATVDNTVTKFAESQMGKNYKFINCVDENEPEAHENIFQKLVITENTIDTMESSLNFIFKSLEQPNFKGIIFVPTTIGVDWIDSVLRSAKANKLYDTDLVHGKFRSLHLKLHGKLSQAKRDRNVKDFRSAKHGLFICTDVAARGLDFKDVTDVIQINPSSSVADYIHKVGRTARAGAKGKATIFLAKDELKYTDLLKRERGVEFSEIIKSNELEKSVENIFQKVNLDDELSEEYIKSYLGFIKQVLFSYRLNAGKVITNTMEFYREVLQSKTTKLRASSTLLGKLDQQIPDVIQEYFLTSGSSRGFSNNRSSKRNTFGDNFGSSSYGRRDSRPSYGSRQGGYSSYSRPGSSGDSYNRPDRSERSSYQRSGNQRSSRFDDF